MASNNQPGKDSPEKGATHSSLWREPLIHFFLLGLVVFGLYGLFEEQDQTARDSSVVEIASADIEWFRMMWKKRMDREPTVEELRGLVNQMIREQILGREAVSLGLDEGDTVIRRRLAQKMDFLFEGLARVNEPADEVLQAYFQENRGAYEIPGQMTFSQVYFNLDERGDPGATAAARQLVRELNSREVAPNDLSTFGDTFLLPSSFPNKTLSEIRRDFGPQFADAVWEQEAGIWSGPVISAYGRHVVLVHERSQGTVPEFGELQERLKADWMEARQEELAAEAYDKLRERYQVLVEGMPYEMDTGE